MACAAEMDFGLPETQLRAIYRQLDSDLSGALDRDELSAMMDVISNINAARVVRVRAYWHIGALLFLLVVIIAVGMFGYAHSHDWTYTNALYFIVVTLTTVGFGDIVPTTGSPHILLWLAHSVLGLGIATSFISAVQDLGVNRKRLKKLSEELLELHIVARPGAEHAELKEKLWKEMKVGVDKLGVIVGNDVLDQREIKPFYSKPKALWGDVRRASGMDAVKKKALGDVVKVAARPAGDAEEKRPGDETPVDALARGGGPLAPDRRHDPADGWLFDGTTWVDPDAVSFVIRTEPRARRRRPAAG